MTRVKFGPNPQNMKEVELKPKRDNLVDFLMNFLAKENPTLIAPNKKAIVRPGLWAKKQPT